MRPSGSVQSLIIPRSLNQAMVSGTEKWRKALRRKRSPAGSSRQAAQVATVVGHVAAPAPLMRTLSNGRTFLQQHHPHVGMMLPTLSAAKRPAAPPPMTMTWLMFLGDKVPIFVIHPNQNRFHAQALLPLPPGPGPLGALPADHAEPDRDPRGNGASLTAGWRSVWTSVSGTPLHPGHRYRHPVVDSVSTG